jgi:hypothetical protein
MKPDEIRKFKFVFQNSGNSPWPSDIKLIRLSGDPLETESITDKKVVNSGVYFMV